MPRSSNINQSKIFPLVNSRKRMFDGVTRILLHVLYTLIGGRCLQCHGCPASDCGNCIYCKDKKVGGLGKKKKGCAQKICTGSIVDKVSIIIRLFILVLPDYSHTIHRMCFLVPIQEKCTKLLEMETACLDAFLMCSTHRSDISIFVRF